MHLLPKDLIAKVRYIEITTGRLVNSVFAGEYQSVFKGRGMEFDEVREYDPQDDIRDIDWNVTARMGHPYTKKFVEEREMTVMLAVDASASLYFGTQGRLKSELVAELAALLAFCAVSNHDRVGLFIFSDKVEKYIPPKKGRTHVLRVIREILSFRSRGKSTNLDQALRTFNDVMTRRSTVFLFSDFLDQGYEKILSVTHKKHDITSIVVADPIENKIPSFLGQFCVRDPETGQEITFRPTSGFAKRYAAEAAAKSQQMKDFFASIAMDFIELRTDKPYIDDVIRFFKQRQRRLQRV